MRYEIERLGDISGKSDHKTLEDAFVQLQREYPKQEDVENGIAAIVGAEEASAVSKYLKDTLHIQEWMPERQTPDPEDDRILIWEITDTGHRKVVWHFSGWHWDPSEYGLPQGILPGDVETLYKLAND